MPLAHRAGHSLLLALTVLSFSTITLAQDQPRPEQRRPQGNNRGPAVVSPDV